MEFQDYTFSVQITVRRRNNEYSSESLCDVQVSEQLTMSPTDVTSAMVRLVTEARDKAHQATNLKHDFEMQAKAIEAGTTVIDGTIG